MLKDAKAFGSFSVRDPEEAKRFYGQVLGLDVRVMPGMEKEGLLELHCGGGHMVMIYPKPGHQPATYTVLNFQVPDLEGTMERMRAQGVSFEQYHGEGGVETDPQGISREGEMAIAWFKDPSGNILSVLRMEKAAQEEELAEVGAGTSI